ncbi:MAG: relaxase domain-containing protein [Nocardiopsaceae bacterium]|nr:relaxase domain-containing protein [Nocardiopsaceae bacterium]
MTIKTGFDVDYYLDQVGVDYYLEASGEPPGVWGGQAATGLGLSGEVDPDVMRALYHHDVGPGGVPLGTAQKALKLGPRRTYAQVQEAIDKRVAEELGELAPLMPDRVRKIRLEERAKTRTRTPYYDMTFSAEKSVSLAHVGLRAEARRIRALGQEAEAEQLEAMARSVEAAVMAGADAMIAHVEQRGAIIRTGHHGAGGGAFRDAAGFIAAKFLQHTSRSGDPQLHVQVPILNRAQRDDGEDAKWRALDGRPLWGERLGAAAYAGLAEAQALARLGFPLVKRPDGNGYEIGGVDQATMDAFSARSADIAAKLAERIAEYTEMFGHPPNRQALFKLRKRVTVETRKAKQKPAQGKQPGTGQAAREAEEELAAWARQAEDGQVQLLDMLPEEIGEYAAEHPEARPVQLPSPAERAEIIRAATAEVQRQNATWTRAKLEWELYRQLPVLPRWSDWGEYLSGLADEILAGQAGDVNVIQVAPVPDVIDVTRLGFRKDGTSIYRPPGEARYVTAAHLDLEEWLLSASKAETAQLVSGGDAAQALAGAGLDIDQREAARGLLASQRAVTSLVAPAGTGKTYTMAAFAAAWTAQTGARVIGLTLSENAARVMAAEGLSEAHNIARFFARKVPVRAGDVLVVDEASQVSTADLARIVNCARRARARVILAGDTEQLGPVEAGGMFRLIAAEGEAHQLAEVHRFAEAWEARASLQLRAGDLAAWEEYATNARVLEGPQDRVHDRAVDWWIADTSRGKETLLLAATNEEAARLAGMARERRIEWGQIPGGRDITLSDGNPAGLGDLIRARHNEPAISAGGRTLANRDVLRITGWEGHGKGRHAIVQRQLGKPGADGSRWSGEFTVPAAYLEEHAELAYAGNVYVAQGRTVDITHLVVSEGMSRDHLYVGMTRGREENFAHVVTGPPDPADYSRQERDAYAKAQRDKRAPLIEAGDFENAFKIRTEPPEPERMRERPPWESVIAAAMERDDPQATAIEAMRAAHDYVTSTRHLYTLAEAGWQLEVVPQIDAMVRQRISPGDYQRYLADPERPAFLQELRRHEIGGRPIPEILDAITAAPLDGARSIAAVLHGRAGKQPAPARGKTTTWAERAPQAAPEWVRDAHGALDDRQAALGEQLAADPPAWALEAWGTPPAEPGKLRDDWTRRAALVQSYREAAGITDPAQAIGPPPSRQAGITEAFAASVRALELPDNAALMRAMGRGDLEARVRDYERAQATAPADRRAELDTAAQAEHVATRAAEAAGERDKNEPAMEKAAWDAQAARWEADRLRVAQAARREWEEAYAFLAEAANQARDELQRRGPVRPGEPWPEPATAPGAQADAGARPHARRETPEPETWAQRKAAQSARVEADRQARREALADGWLTPEVIAEMDMSIAGLHAKLDRVAEGITAQHQHDGERDARRREELINEPVPRAEAAAELEATADTAAEADHDAGLEI